MAFIEQLSLAFNLWNYDVKIKKVGRVFAVRRIRLFGMSFFFFLMGSNQSSSEMLVQYSNLTF